MAGDGKKTRYTVHFRVGEGPTVRTTVALYEGYSDFTSIPRILAVSRGVKIPEITVVMARLIEPLQTERITLASTFKEV